MTNRKNSNLLITSKKSLGFPSLFVVALGVVSAQSCIVSTLQGTGIGGLTFCLALCLGFILTLCYIFSYCELALMMPKAGSISTYTAVASGHFLAIIAALAGYLSGLVFGIPAELLVVDQVLEMAYPGTFQHTGILLLFLFTILNILGIDIFATIQNILVYTMIAAICITCVTGLIQLPENTSAVVQNVKPLPDLNFLPLLTLAIWAFLSIEFVCTLSEETKKPVYNLPYSMYATAIAVLLIHVLLCYTGSRLENASELNQTDVPHWHLVKELLGEEGKWMISVITVTTTSGVLNSVLATISRMLSGMAKNGQLPEMFQRNHPKYNTPWISILFLALIMGLPLLLVQNMQGALAMLIVSAAAVWLFTYIIAHYNVMKLRKMYPAQTRPYKSPWYPYPQIIGITGMSYAIIINSPSKNQLLQVYGNTVMFLGITGLYAFLWVKYKMKKKLFSPEPIEEALKA